ncbi:hypothetical protein Tco_0422604 [Tanacetum coccineum]
MRSRVLRRKRQEGARAGRRPRHTVVGVKARREQGGRIICREQGVRERSGDKERKGTERGEVMERGKGRTPPLLRIPLPAPSTISKANIPEADTPPRKRLLLTTPRPSCEVGESSAAAAAR